MTNWKLAPVAFALAALAVAVPQRGMAADLSSGPTPVNGDQLAALGGDPFQALVTKVVRTVEWQRARTRLWQAASVNNMLAVGDTVRTGAEAKAELLYGDGSVTRLGSQTSLTLSGADRRELHLDGGRVWMHIMKHNAGMKVITPGAVAAVTGTELMVDYDPVQHATQVTVFEGAVNVTGDVGNLVKVVGGTTTMVPMHAPAAVPAPIDNSKLQERENIFHPLSLEDNGTKPAVEVPNTSATTAPNTTNPNTGVTTTTTATSAPVTTTTTTTNTPTTPVQPDLKGQTDTLQDPRLINGSPTSGTLKVIIK